MTNVGKNSMIVVLLALSMVIVWVAVLYQTVALFILAGGLLAIVGLVIGTAGVSFNVFMLAIAFVSELWLGDIDFGPFSLRVYLMAGLLVFLFTTLAFDRTPLFTSKQSQSLAILFIVFMLWMILCKIAQGNSLSDILVRMASTHMTGLIIFVLVQKLVGKSQDYRFLAIVILMAIVVSSLIAILQQNGVEWALALKDLLRSGSTNTLLSPVEVNRGLPSGLSPSTFAMSYQVAVGLMIVMVLFAFPGSNKKQKFTLSVCFLVLGFTLWLIQERSAMVALVAAMVLFLLWIWRAPVQQRYGKKTVFYNFAILVILGIFFFTFQFIFGPAASQVVNSRLTNLYDAGRIILLRQALAFGMTHWFWGGGPALFLLTTASDLNSYYRNAVPHNLFLNALAYYGIPGLTFAVAICLRLFNDCKRFLEVALGRLDVLMVGMVFALFAYLINAQFHNASFVTGDPLIWWLIGIIYTSPVVLTSVDLKKTSGPIQRFER